MSQKKIGRQTVRKPLTEALQPSALVESKTAIVTCFPAARVTAGHENVVTSTLSNSALSQNFVRSAVPLGLKSAEV